MAGTRDVYKAKRCKVLNYNDKDKTLDIDFDGFGIRLNDIDKCDNEFISVKYKGEIGKENFTCKL